VCNDVPASKLPPVKHPAIQAQKINFTLEEVLDLFGRYHQDLFLWTGTDDTEWIQDNIINPKQEV
jgi:hypothetical protein